MLANYSKGFFAISDRGMIALWVKSEENNATSEKEAYDFIRKWQSPACANILPISIDLNPTEEYAIIALENNNLGKLSIKSIGLNEDLTKPI